MGAQRIGRLLVACGPMLVVAGVVMAISGTIALPDDPLDFSNFDAILRLFEDFFQAASWRSTGTGLVLGGAALCLTGYGWLRLAAVSRELRDDHNRDA